MNEWLTRPGLSFKTRLIGAKRGSEKTEVAEVRRVTLPAVFEMTSKHFQATDIEDSGKGGKASFSVVGERPGSVSHSLNFDFTPGRGVRQRF